MLDFSVNIEIVNCTTNVLDEYNQNVLLTAFTEIIEIPKEYLSFAPHNLRRLYIIILENTYYVLDETIYISIPLINKYSVYKANPTGLYDSLTILIADSISSGLFVYTVKEYNTTVFDRSVVNLLEIGKPTVKTVNTPGHAGLSNYDLSLIISMGILGILFGLFFFIFVFLPKINKKKSKESYKRQNVNKIYSISKNNPENLKSLLEDPPIIEESRIVEAANNECSV